jgi:hypothetical protein
MDLMMTNRDILDQIAKTLIEKEKIDGGQLLDIIEALKPELIPQGARSKVAEVIARSSAGMPVIAAAPA